jgi:uncharacterized protein YkwD
VTHHRAVRAAAGCGAASALILAAALVAAVPNASAAQTGAASNRVASHTVARHVASRATVTPGVHLNSFEARLVVDMNRVRRGHHLAPLTVVPGTTDVARHWSWKLARAQALSHNPALVPKLERHGSSQWTEIEENVGYGPVTSPDVLFEAYMHSAPHRANILGKHVSEVGIGVVQRGSYAWNTVDFVNQYSSSYGASRVPADGLSSDAVTPRSTTLLTRGADPAQRFGAARANGVSASPAHFSNGATHTHFASNARHGYGALLFRDALSLKYVTALRFRLGATSRSHGPVKVTIKIGNGWRMRTLRTVHAAAPRTFTISVPRSERKLLTTIQFNVSGRSVDVAAHRVTLSVANLTAIAH